MSVWDNLPKPFTVLAPMEDVTDTVFRRLIGELGAPDLYFTEFTSTDGMFSPGGERVCERLEYTKKELPLIAQIWGNNPENYFRASKELVKRGFDGIDINMGCPVPKITSKGCCSALIDNPTLAKELILAAKEGAADIPVSVKTRIGFKSIQTEQWFSFLLEQNLPAITIHGRVAKHQSKYPANWDEIKKAVELKNKISPETLIIGNGDLYSQADIAKRIEETKIDGAMVARGIFHNPFIFRNTAPFSIVELNTEQKLKILLRHLELFTQRWGQDTRYPTMKRFYKVYINDFANASSLRVRLMETQQPSEAIEIIKDFIRPAQNSALLT